MSNNKHPTEMKNILQAARQLYNHHKKTKKIIPRLRNKAQRDLMGVVKYNKTHYQKEQSYDTDYHFFIRSIRNGSYKQSIKRQEHAIECAKKRLEQCIKHVNHWMKVAKIYEEKAIMETKTIQMRKINLEAYKLKCQRTAERYKNMKPRSK